MYEEIIDSYIFEVTKHLSKKDKAQIEDNLREDIYLRLDDYMGGRSYDEPTEEDIKRVLEDFARPEDIVNTYGLDKYKSYIAKPFARSFRTSWILAFVVVALSIVGSLVLSYILEGRVLNIEKLVQAIGGVFGSLSVVYGFFSFAYSRVGGARYNKSSEKFVNSLKLEPDKSSRIRAYSRYFQIIVSGILLGVFVFSRDILNISYPQILILEEVAVSVAPLMILVYFIDVLALAYKDVDRRYSLGVLLSTTLKHLGLILIGAFVFASYDLGSSLVHQALAEVLGDNTFSAMVLGNLGLSIFFVIVGVSVLSIVYVAISFHLDKKKFGQRDEGEEDLVWSYEEGEEESYDENTSLNEKLEDEISENSSDITLDEDYIQVDEGSITVEDRVISEDSDWDQEDDIVDEFYNKELGQDTQVFKKDDLSEETIVSSVEARDLEDGPISEKSTKTSLEDETILAYTKSEIDEDLKNDKKDTDDDLDKTMTVSEAIRRSNPSNED